VCRKADFSRANRQVHGHFGDVTGISARRAGTSAQKAQQDITSPKSPSGQHITSPKSPSGQQQDR